MTHSSRSILLATLLALILLALLAWGVTWWRGRPTRAEGALRMALAARLAAAPAAPGNLVEAEVREFYGRRGRRAAWSDARGPGADAAELTRALATMDREGLDPAGYEAAALRAGIERLRGAESNLHLPIPDTLADLDLRLTRAFLRCASDLHDGRLPDSALDSSWVAARGTVDPVRTLRRALGAHRIGPALAELAPAGDAYRALRAALARYRAIAAAGGWPRLAEGPPLRRGARGPRVAMLRRRLAVEGDSSGIGEAYDAELARAVRAFQARHGLTEDAVVDTATRAALNVDAPARVRQLELNLERLRWYPPAWTEPCVIVNLPAFALELRDSGRVQLRSRVVVGEPRNPTPSFSAALSHVVVNPTWRLPKRILVEETLPALARDTSWLTKHSMRVLFTHGPELVEVPRASVDWSAIEEDTFPYLVVQDPGDENPLGRVKLMCPNPYDVYLHDTPLKGYFSAVARAYSHGCVRVEKARELADWLLAHDTLAVQRSWTGRPRPRTPDVRDSMDLVIASLATRRVGLRAKVPVHFLYATAWVDSGGAVQFRSDLYGIDRRLDEALRSGKVADFVLNPPLEWGEKHRRTPLETPGAGGAAPGGRTGRR